MDSTKGIYLYDADAFTTPTPVRQMYTTPTRERRQSLGVVSVPSSTSSNGPRAPPAAEHGLRTNFKTTPSASEASYPATPPVTHLDFHGDPILEEDDKMPMHPTYARKTAGLGSSVAILVSALLGVGLGFGLGKLSPSTDTLNWIALPGNLFVRALKCLIVPLVFCTMTVSIAEVIELKRTSLLTLRTAGVFFLTSCLSACQGMAAAVAYRGLIATTTATVTKTVDGSQLAFSFKCANGLFMQTLANGSVACLEATNATAASVFAVTDVNNVLNFAKTDTKLSLTEQAIAIIDQVVPDNIFS
ncbi:dicarboxylate/amino acid:cation (Na or H) symporter (DAACS) family protein, partial [Achlya hypogyna]